MSSTVKGPLIKSRKIRKSLSYVKGLLIQLRSALFAIVRPILWLLQRLTGRDSRWIGTPSRRCDDAFDYLHATEGDCKIHLLEEGHVQHRTPPPTAEDPPHPAFEKNRSRPQDAIYVVELPQARVFGRSGTIITENDTLLEKECWEGFIPTVWDRQVYQRFTLPRVDTLRGTLAVMSTRYESNYYHWMMDTLPRFHVLKALGLWESVDRFYLQAIDKSFIRDSLRALGIEAEKVVQGADSPHIIADTILAPSRVNIDGICPRWIGHFLKETFDIHQPDHSTPSRIYISRRDVAIRRILNEDEVINVLEPLGFETVSMSGLSVRQQAMLHQNAEVIVGPHGANLTNIAFCRPKTKLLEIFSANFVNPCYWYMSTHLGLDYSYINGEGKRLPIPKRLSIFGDEDITVNIGKFRRALTQLGIQ